MIRASVFVLPVAIVLAAPVAEANVTSVTPRTSVAASAPSGGPAVSTSSCATGWYMKPDRVRSVKIRIKPSASSTAVGTLKRGQKLPVAVTPNHCAVVKGGWYTGCGKRDRYWAGVRYKGRTRYVANNCVITTR